MNTLIEAAGLGFIGGMIPGSILTILLISVMQGGFKTGLRAFWWCLGGELITVTILLCLIFSLPIPRVVFDLLGLVGCGVLSYFAWQVSKLRRIENPDNQVFFSPKKIILMASTNAPLYIFWLTVCAPLIIRLSENWGILKAASTFMITFEVAWSISTFTVMLLFVKGREYLRDQKIMGKVYIGAATLMLIVSLRMLHLSLSSLLA
jgi:threonine/homoserine/homoserine lactone efflux protein